MELLEDAKLRAPDDDYVTKPVEDLEQIQQRASVNVDARSHLRIWKLLDAAQPAGPVGTSIRTCTGYPSTLPTSKRHSWGIKFIYLHRSPSWNFGTPFNLS